MGFGGFVKKTVKKTVGKAKKAVKSSGKAVGALSRGDFKGVVKHSASASVATVGATALPGSTGDLLSDALGQRPSILGLNKSSRRSSSNDGGGSTGPDTLLTAQIEEDARNAAAEEARRKRLRGRATASFVGPNGSNSSGRAATRSRLLGF